MLPDQPRCPCLECSVPILVPSYLVTIPVREAHLETAVLMEAYLDCSYLQTINQSTSQSVIIIIIIINNIIIIIIYFSASP